MLTRRVCPILIAALFAVATSACHDEPARREDSYSPEAQRLLPSASLTDSVSYLLGVNFAAMLNYGGGGSDGDDFGEIDMQRVKEGIDDFFKADAEGRYRHFSRGGFSGEEYEEFKEEFDIDPALAEELINRYLEARLNARGKDNQDKGKAFFEENKEREGVREISVRYADAHGDSLTSFLQYEILTAGNGPRVARGDSLLISYSARHLKGKVFDVVDSLAVPVFADTLFLQGFSAGLRELREGDVATIYVPSELGFGDGRDPQGRPFFSPYAALVFDLTVHAVVAPESETEEKNDNEAEESAEQESVS